jgi:hypothetical protein
MGDEVVVEFSTRFSMPKMVSQACSWPLRSCLSDEGGYEPCGLYSAGGQLNGAEATHDSYLRSSTQHCSLAPWQEVLSLFRPSTAIPSYRMISALGSCSGEVYSAAEERSLGKMTCICPFCRHASSLYNSASTSQLQPEYFD